MPSKNKTLSASSLKQLHSKTFTTKKIILDVEGTNYEVFIDEKFKISKVQSLILELIDKQKYFTTIEEVFSISSYIPFLLIKYFTNLDISKTDDFTEQLKLFEIMLDLGIVDKILSEFDENETEKINKYINKAKENVEKIKDNPEVLKELTNTFTKVDEFIEGDE